MYLHLGQDVVIRSKEIIGIFDLERSSISKRTKEFLSHAAKEKQVVTVSYELPKTFIVTEKRGKKKVFISQISASTLQKRANKAGANRINQK